MIRRTLLSSLLALVLVAAPAAALPSGMSFHPAGWLAVAWDGFLTLFTVEKTRGVVDPNGESDTEDVRGTFTLNAVAGPRASVGPGTT